MKVTQSLTIIALGALCTASFLACSSAAPEPSPMRSILHSPRESDAGAKPAEVDSGATLEGGRPEGDTHPIVTQECGESSDDNLCHRCEDEHCCETHAAFLDNPTAMNLKECLLSCYERDVDPPTNAACELACIDRFPGALEVWAPRLACVTIHCGEKCGAEPLSECMRCRVDECAAQLADNTGTAQGFLLGVCVVGCGDHIPCVYDCGQQYPDANPASAAEFDCISAYCPVCIQSS